MLTYLLKDSNILCLQDTHLTATDINNLIVTFPEHEFFVDGVKTNSRGVLIILKKNFEYKVKNIFTDNSGNLIILDLQLADMSLRILNIYAPNTDNPHFFKKIANYVEQSTEIYTLICGDLNLVLDPKMD